MARMLLSNANLLLKLINDLLDLSRIEAGQIDLELSEFKVNELINELQTMFETQAQQKKIKLVLNDNTAGRTVRGDRTRVQQILMNIISNALKFTEKGEVRLTATAQIEGLNTKLVFEIKDTGIGIVPEKLPNIFDKFTQADETITRRFGGSGLGLSISSLLAEVMNGFIQVTSTPNKGSVFTVTLLLESVNVAATPAKHTPAPLPETDKETCQGTVLVVEDYLPNIMVASMMLENMGFNVVTSENGQQAIEQIANATTPFTAILMDVQMQGIDGLETTRRIRQMEHGKDFRHVIIGVTAHALAGDRERCLAAGMDDYISKPIHPEILSSKLRQILRFSRKNRMRFTASLSPATFAILVPLHQK